MNTKNLSELQYDSMKGQLKKTFSDSSGHIPIKEESLITSENALLVAGFEKVMLTDSYHDNATNTTEYYLFREQQPGDLYRENNNDFLSCSGEHGPFYNKNNYCPIIFQANPHRTNQAPATRFQPYTQYVPPSNRQSQNKIVSSEREEKSM